MTKRNKTKATLLSCGSLIPNLHYGPFSRDWWYTTTIENEVLLVPIRLGMTITTTLNEQKFILHVVQGHSRHSQQPGYCCQAGVLSSNVEESCSAALTFLYQRIFQTKTKVSGPQELGFDDEKTASKTLHHHSYIHIAKKEEITYRCLEKNGYSAKVDGFVLFGLKDDYTKKRLESSELLTCRPTDWTNDEIMNALYPYYLKKRTLANINWQSIFLQWVKKGSGIIEIWSVLQKIYPENHIFNERERRAWQAFLRAAGCTNITPFGIDKSKYEFWMKEINPLHYQEILYTLSEHGFLRTTPFVDSSKPCNNFTERLADCLIESYEANKKVLKAKEEFFSDVTRTIQEARKFARINEPGCSIIEKPVFHRTRFSEEAKNQFEIFFSDKSIVNMSSYKVDPQTKLPVLYLKDSKTALLEKFSETYSGGFKRTTFMTELAQGRFQYHEDLDDLLELISVQIKDLKYQSILIDKVEKIRKHMKRDYEKEISINTNGQVNHDPCISHCLAYAFGICENIHVSICEKCNELWMLFRQLQFDLDESCSVMLNEALKQKINKPEPTCTPHSTPKVLWNIPIPDSSIHLNPKRMRLSEIQNELIQRDVLFEGNQNRTELSILLQKNLDEKRNAGSFRNLYPSSSQNNTFNLLDVLNSSYST
ncbi:3163_t:CDS:10, partial [Diversispora eburnea]